MPARLEQTESELHRAVAQYLSLVLAPPALFSTFPLGGGGKVRGAQLKRIGTIRGMPDIVLILPRGIACWIELKSAKGRLSPEQRAVHALLERAGCRCGVARSLVDVEKLLEEWNVPRKGYLTSAEAIVQTNWGI